MERIGQRQFHSEAFADVEACRNTSGAVLIGQDNDSVVIDWRTFLRICRHLGVTAAELEGGK